MKLRYYIFLATHNHLVTRKRRVFYGRWIGSYVRTLTANMLGTTYLSGSRVYEYNSNCNRLTSSTRSTANITWIGTTCQLLKDKIELFEQVLHMKEQMLSTCEIIPMASSASLRQLRCSSPPCPGPVSVDRILGFFFFFHFNSAELTIKSPKPYLAYAPSWGIYSSQKSVGTPEFDREN